MRIKWLFLLNVNYQCENAALLLLELINRGSFQRSDKLFSSCCW